MWVIAALFACKGDPQESVQTAPASDSEPDWYVEPPALEMPEPGVYLARELTLTAPEPVTVEVWLTGGDRPLGFASTEWSEHHAIPVVGLSTETAYQVVVDVTTADGTRVSNPLSLETRALPEGFPSIEVLARDPERVHPGAFLLDLNDVPSRYLAAILDEELRWTWVYDSPVNWGDLELDPDGTLWGLQESGDLVHLDLLGRELGRWSATGTSGAVALELPSALHHDVSRGDHSLLALIAEPVDVPEYPVGYATPFALAPATLHDTTVVELDWAGTLLGQWRMSELLEPRRLGWDGLLEGELGLDWAHGNAVSWMPDGGILVSLRHQDAVVAFDRTGEVRWILGNHDGWPPAFADKLLQPTGPIEWPSHQHGAEITEAGLVVMFDNGNYDGTPYQPGAEVPPASRAVGYLVDEAAMEITEVFSYDLTSTGPEFSAALGDAILLEGTGNVFSTYGLSVSEGGVLNIAMGVGATSVRLVEHAPGIAEPVLDVRLSSSLGDNPNGWTSFRGVRIPSLTELPWAIRVE